MSTVRYVHWQDGDAWLGYLGDYPDYWTFHPSRLVSEPGDRRLPTGPRHREVKEHLARYILKELSQ